MREPSPSLVRLLERLHLATADSLREAAPRVAKLAGDLPDFDSVWVDALVQLRRLTPLQAARVNAGRGDTLLCGDYLITHALAGPYYAECFAARHRETGTNVRLYCVEKPQASTAETVQAIAALVEQSRTLAPAACAVEQAGTDGKRVWAICRMTEGTTAGQWLLEHGRFPHEAVWQIAFEIAQHLTTLERQGITHGDLGAAGLLLTVRGEVLLPMPGLRGLLRPREGFSCSELQPAAYDYLAPERVVEGSAPTTSSDVYAFAALCWHLLAGRPPIAGGTSVTKLKNIQRAKIADVRQLAPQTPPRLAQTIARCLARDPAERPTSFQAVLEMLGTPPPSAAMALRDCLNRREATWQTLGRPPARRRKSRVRPLAQAGPWVALALFAAAIPWWLHSRVPESPKIAGNQVAKQKQNVATDAALPPAVESSAAAATPMDRQVVKASAAEPLPAPKVDLWEIPAGSVLTAADIELRPGMRVKAAPGPRPRVELSAEPLRIDCDGVCFEGIDFVLSDSGEKKGTPAPRTMLEVNAPSIEFRGCSFVAWTTTPPTAILWLGSDDSFAEPGSATLTDCVCRDVAALFDVRCVSEAHVHITNALCIAAGPLVRVPRATAHDAALSMTLDHATLRGDSAVLECVYSGSQRSAASTTLSVQDCVFDINPDQGLLSFRGPTAPTALLPSVVWNGQGSLLTPRTGVAMWQRGAHAELLAEESLDMGGLVRSRVEFAGPAAGPLSASRITRWDAPLRSADPPGANPATLAMPKR